MLDTSRPPARVMGASPRTPEGMSPRTKYKHKSKGL
jgi:hypothetical protein